MVKCIIFDMDGVLLDSEPYHKMAAGLVLERYGVVRTDNMDFTGMPVRKYWGIFRDIYKLPKTVDELAAEYYECVATLVEENALPRTEGLDQVVDWVQTNGFKTGLASSSSRLLVDRTLKHLGLTDFINYSVAGDEVERCKPESDPYRKVLALAGVKAEEAVAIEDSESGVHSAQGAGVYCFGYINPTSGVRDISNADCVIRDLRELITAERIKQDQ